MVNEVWLIGRLVADPSLKKTPSGKSVTEFTLAVDRPADNEGNRSADFIPCEAWGVTAENMERYLGKGRLIAVLGRISVNRYEVNGEQRKKMVVVAQQVQFLDRPKNGQGQGARTAAETEDVPF